VAEVSNAPVICNKTILKEVDGKMLMLGPRDRGLAFTKQVKNVQTLSVDETIELDGMTITGIKTTHGSLTIKMGPFSKTEKTGPSERIGWGSLGFEISYNEKKVINLGDTLLHRNEWQKIKNPDVLMIPIGGKAVHNTMDEREALEAVQIIRPTLVIPCHYNCPALFTRKLNPADDKWFKMEVENLGISCAILQKGESIEC
jgi:L-ascorbate metabolism protein UlaG (beta-lactamase superfamily)